MPSSAVPSSSVPSSWAFSAASRASSARPRGRRGGGNILASPGSSAGGVGRPGVGRRIPPLPPSLSRRPARVAANHGRVHAAPRPRPHDAAPATTTRGKLCPPRPPITCAAHGASYALPWRLPVPPQRRGPQRLPCPPRRTHGHRGVFPGRVLWPLPSGRPVDTAALSFQRMKRERGGGRKTRVN